ncbi:MAG TPA: hypothetical protein VGR43_06055 [Dehalococcoidia bacterium]|jgi:hypothetical protein|nr:hypothetical protein [Dehalococcoidia bacterium]
MTSLQELSDEFIGPLDLTWRLDDRSKRRLKWTCALPAILIVALVIRIVIEYSYAPEDLRSDESGPPELVQALHRAATSLDLLTPAAVAVLFLAGLRSWSRVEGSWMLLGGGLLATVAIAFVALITLVYTATTDFNVLRDLRVLILWPEIAQTFGLLAVGFFFLAYRGLSSRLGETPAPITGTNIET